MSVPKYQGLDAGIKGHMALIQQAGLNELLCLARKAGRLTGLVEAIARRFKAQGRLPVERPQDQFSKVFQAAYLDATLDQIEMWFPTEDLGWCEALDEVWELNRRLAELLPSFLEGPELDWRDKLPPGTMDPIMTDDYVPPIPVPRFD